MDGIEVICLGIVNKVLKYIQKYASLDAGKGNKAELGALLPISFSRNNSNIPIFISTILMDIEVFIIGRNIIIESIIAIVLVVVQK